MSVRDEIAQILFRLGIDEGHKGIPPKSSIAADALMPIVERVAREAVEEGYNSADDRGPYRESFDDIVRRVCGE